MNFNTKIYGQMLAETVPSIIDCRKSTLRLEAISDGLFKDDRSPEEGKLFDLLANLLEDFEHRTLPLLEESCPLKP